MFASPFRRVPERYRPALKLETLYALNSGTMMTLFSISLVVLETVLHAELFYSFLLALIYLGSNFFSPYVTWLGRRVPMRLLVVLPNLCVAALLWLVLLPWLPKLTLTLVVGGAFVLRTFTQVGEMNMYRISYPVRYRSAAVGWTRAVWAFSGLLLTLLSWWWLAYRPDWYAALYCLVGCCLVAGSLQYNRIPVPARNDCRRDDGVSPLVAFQDGLRIFLRDRRFLYYQLAFATAGLANHMALFLIPRVIKENVTPHPSTLAFIVTVLPTLVIIISAPFWGKYIANRTPMYARGLFNVLQVLAYAFYCLGGLRGELWPFVVGTICHALCNGGGQINWLTGSMYFARPEQVSLYNGIHVALTGLRGILGPIIGFLLFIPTQTIGGVSVPGANLGPWVFGLAAAMTAVGVAMMFHQHATDVPDAATLEAPAMPAPRAA